MWLLLPELCADDSNAASTEGVEMRESLPCPACLLTKEPVSCCASLHHYAKTATQHQSNTTASHAAAGQHHGIIRSSRATPRHHTQQQGNTMKPHASAGHYHGAVYGHCHGLIQQQGTATALYSSTRALPRPYTALYSRCYHITRGD